MHIEGEHAVKLNRNHSIMIAMVSELVGLIVLAAIGGAYFESQGFQKGLISALLVAGAFLFWIVHLLIVLKKLEDSGTQNSDSSADE